LTEFGATGGGARSETAETVDARIEKKQEDRMKYLFVGVVVLSGTLASAGVFRESLAQEHKHEERKEAKETPGPKQMEPAKAESNKCCEGMEKMGGMKGDMKAKMEKMKAVKEKMKSGEGMKTKDAKSQAKSNGSDQGEHEH
jgi:hypothetical protein